MDPRSLVKSLTAFGVEKSIIGDVINGDLTTFKKFLESQDSFPIDNWHDLYDLASCALGEDRSDFAKLLFQNYIKTNKVRHTGFLLNHAVFKKDNKMFHLLVSEAIIHIDQQDAFGRTLLHYATVESIPIFLSYGASLDIKDNDGYCALHLLIINDYKAAEILLEHKAKISGIDVNDKHAMRAAVQKLCCDAVDEIMKLRYFSVHSMKDVLKPVVCGNESICETIINSFMRHDLAFYAEDADDMEFLLMAVKKEYSKIVEELLKFKHHNKPHSMLCTTMKHLNAAIQSGEIQSAGLLRIFQAYIKSSLQAEDYQICAAIKNRDFRLMEMILANGAEAYSSYKLLATAFDTRNTVTIELLLQYGVDINCKDRNGMTILHWCMNPEPSEYDLYTYSEFSNKPFLDVKQRESLPMNTNSEICRMLVKRGANVNSKDSMGLTPLHLAAKNNYCDLVEFLLSSGANINYKSMEGYTALHCAVERKATNVVDVLLKHGAAVGSKDMLGATPLHICSTIEICRLLLENGADVNSVNDEESTPMMEAVARGDWAVAETLLDSGANINHRDRYGFTALHKALVNNHVNLVDDLLKYNPDVKLRDKCGGTVLHYCTGRRSLEICQLLFERGADLNCKDDEGSTPLHCVVQADNSDTVKYFLDLGIDINCTNNYGNTVLHIAYNRGSSVEIIKTLLACGADINIRNKKNYTAYQMRKIDTEVLQMMYSLHVLKMKTANLFVCNPIIRWLNNCLEMSGRSEATKYENECTKELERIKTQKIGNSNFSLYQILKGNSIEFVRNEDVVQYLKKYNFLKNFPIYGDMLRYRYYRCLRRVELMDEGTKVYQNLFRAVLMDKSLPYICIKKVFGYLSDYDLEMLIKACENVD